MKKLLTFLLPTLFLFPQLASASFPDVTSETEYLKAIQWMSDNGVVQGYPDGNFKPDDCVDRVEFLKMEYEMLGTEMQDADLSIFSDAKENEWYSPYLETALANGTVNGYPDGTFKPEQCVSRVEAAKIAVLTFYDGEVPSQRGSYYPYYYEDPVDLQESEWYFDYLDYLLSNNLIGMDHVVFLSDEGVSDYYFDPAGAMTRKEVAEMLYRMKAARDNSKNTYYSYYKPFPQEEFLFNKECQINQSETPSTFDLTSALDTDSDLVFYFDHTSSTQYKNFKNLIGSNTESDIWSAVFQGMGTDILDAVFGEWEVAVGLTYQSSTDFTAQILVRTDQADSFETYLASMLQRDTSKDDISCTVTTDTTLWDAEVNEYYSARTGDFFVIASTPASRSEALANAKTEKGFNSESHYSKLAFLYIDFNDMFDLIEDEVLSQLTQTFYLSSLEDISDFWLSLNAKSDGILFHSEMVAKSENSDLINMYKGKTLTLEDRVPGEGLVIYSEERADIESLLSWLNISADITDQFKTGRYAFTASLLEQNIPAFAVYLEIPEGNESTVQELNNLLLTEIAYEDSLQGELNQETGLNTYTLDESKLSTWDVEDIEAIFPSVDSIEIYFGLIEPDLYVLAVYPNFPEAFENADPVSQNTAYLSALSGLSNPTAGVGYIDFETLMNFITSKVNDDISEVTEYTDFIDYLVSSTWVEGRTVISDIFLKF
ncbi:S-layer homology domain-containing protein [Patescibacteria group bacterium]|nr:S-layer homology domain-containing protein [Patescibacteria group bacterium]